MAPVSEYVSLIYVIAFEIEILLGVNVDTPIYVMHPATLHGVGVITKLYFAIFVAFMESLTLNLAQRLFEVIDFGSVYSSRPSVGAWVDKMSSPRSHTLTC